MELTENLISDSVKIEKKILEPCVLLVEYTIPADKVSQAYDRIAKEFAKHSKMDGFRPGKAPVTVVKSIHKKSIEEETLKELISASVKKFTDEKENGVLTYSFVKDKSPELKLGSDFAFAVRFNIAPEFEIPNYKGIVVQVERSESTEEDIDNKIRYFREMCGKFEKVDDGAKEGDLLKVSYTSDVVLTEDMKDNVKRIVNSDMNFLWVSRNNMIPGLDKAVIGTKSNDEIKFRAEFPADYDEAALAGKVVNYNIKIAEVQRKSTTSSDDELCKRFESRSIDEVREKIKNELSNGNKRDNEAKKRIKVVEALAKDLTFPVPPDILNSMIETELSSIASEKISRSKDRAQVTKELEENKEAFINEAKERATKKLRNILLFKKIGDMENITVDNHEVERHIKSLSHYYGYKAEDLAKRLISSGNLDKVYEDVLINKAIDFVVEHANVEYVTKNA